MAYAQSNDNSEVVVLNAGWEFSQAGTELWRPAQVPGTVHQDLIYHKQIPDPFYGINEQKIQWVENEDWEYRTAFTEKTFFTSIFIHPSGRQCLNITLTDSTIRQTTTITKNM